MEKEPDSHLTVSSQRNLSKAAILVWLRSVTRQSAATIATLSDSKRDWQKNWRSLIWRLNSLLHLIILPRWKLWSAMEQGRLSLFVPVLFAIGIGFYFSLKSEPSLVLAIQALLVIGVVWQFFKAQYELIRRLLLVMFVICAGFLCASLRTQMVNAPQLEKEIPYADIVGEILQVEHRDTGWRILIAPHSIERVASDHLPAKIRINWRGKNLIVGPGDFVELTASLSPLPSPVLPGGYDYGRHLYFQQIGGVGYGVSQPAILNPSRLGELRLNGQGLYLSTKKKLLNFVENQRVALFRRIRMAAPGQDGAIVAAIVTGKREAIDEASEAALRDSGLAHLLAISGLHMGLATGLIFFGVRFLLAIHPWIALHAPIKKFAAIAALFSGFLYLILSGSGWSARRAFIMSAIMFISILIDRRALSLRNVAVAAIIILILTPEALLHPGFQMSFAAVTALIAAFEWSAMHYRQKLQSGQIVDDFEMQGWWSRFKRYGIGVAATDTIAALATAPFALYHFHRTALYSLPANLFAMPVMGFWVMPSIILALLAMPLGMDGIFWKIAASGIGSILSMGSTVSAWPGAIKLVASQSDTWLVSLCLGGIILCLLRAPWRLAGLLALPFAVFMMITTSKPLVLISESGQNVGFVVSHNGREQLAVFDRRKGAFTTKVWMENLGLDEQKEKPLWLRDITACDGHGCVIKQGNDVIAVSSSPMGLARDCSQANLVIALYPVNRRLAPECHAQLLDQRGAWNVGARSLWENEQGGFTIKTVAQHSGNRPWREGGRRGVK